MCLLEVLFWVSTDHDVKIRQARDGLHDIFSESALTIVFEGEENGHPMAYH